MKPKHFILTMLALLTSTSSFADVPEGNITFADDAVKAICIANWDTNRDGELSYAEAAAVTDIGTKFQSNNDIITFNELQYFTSVTSLNSAFWVCNNLTSIILPNSITSLNRDSFSECWSLASVNIPESVTTIDSYAFNNCSSLTSIDIPDGVTSIGNNAFSGCSSLTSINIPEGVTSIGHNAFQGCSSLTSINIPESVTSIGNSAFRGCSSLTSINIPYGVTSIVDHAFSGCTGLASISIPSSVTSIGEDAFGGCSSLTSINIPNSVTSIGGSAFAYCSSLTSINIPNSVTSIGGSAFYSCSNLTSINIPNSVTSIGGYAFYDCSSLTAVHFGSSSTPQYAYNGAWNQAILFVPDGAVDVYQAAWPEHATQVVPESSNTYLYTVTVTALENASAVIQEIGDENALKVVNLKVSGTINSYDVMVFRNKMLNLRNLDLSEATIVASDYTYLDNQYKTKNNVITSYFAPSTLWSIILPSNITVLDANAFRDCSYLTTIIVPESVTSLGGDVFNGCSRLQSVTLPSGITEIPDALFGNCAKLSSINLPQGVTSIGNSAFYCCSSLTSIFLPKRLNRIGKLAFFGCSLSQIKLPPYLESFGNGAFSGCYSLNDITVYIPDYSLSVSEDAFATYTTATLKIPRFLYNDYYYSQGGWKRFVNMEECDLQPGDYPEFPVTTTNSIEAEEERLPNNEDGSPINGEIFDQGTLIIGEGVGSNTPQEFDIVDQYINGEGQGGSLIGQDDGQNQGNLAVNTLRVKINVKAGRWYFFCFPFDVTIANCQYPGQYAWRYYDGAYRAEHGSGGWKPVTSGTLNALEGYAFQASHTGNLIITFNSPVFGGNRPKTLVAHASANAANASWNLVGNPYSCFYDFLSDAFTSPITVYNNGTYSAYRPGDDECHLYPYQAFFVQKPIGVDLISFVPEHREGYLKSVEVANNRHNARRRAGINPQRRLINLEILNGEEQVDKTRVVLNNEKSRNYELDCDAAKMMSNEAVAQLYSIENGINMAINERPVEGDIRLGYTAKTAGRLSISASRMDMPMMLVDTQLGTTFDLSLGSYDFDTAAGTFDSRFLLRPSGEATAINQLAAKTGVCIGTQDGGIAIGGAEGKTVRVFNAAGAEVGANDGNGFINLRSGIYVVSVDGVNAKVRVK